MRGPLATAAYRPTPDRRCEWSNASRYKNGTSGNATTSISRKRSPSLPPPRHFVGNLTTQGLEERTQFRPWHHRHGRSILHDDLDEHLSRDRVPLGRHRDLPGARHVFEEPNQP